METSIPSGTSSGSLVLMRFRPAWIYIDGVREFGRFFCQTTFARADVAERVRMIIQETLENAVKYSVPGPDSELELRIMAGGSHLEISVCSLPSPEHVQSLKQEIQRINDAEPEQAYLHAFERAADTPDGPARLGLARVRYEGNMELDLQEEDGGRVRVTARGTL